MIFEQINNLPTEMQDILEDMFKTKVKTKSKMEHIKFYYELFELVQSNEQVEDNEEDDNDGV